MDLASLLPDAARGPAALALADLIEARHERASAVDEVDRRQRAASEAVSRCSDELAALEARGDARADERKRAEGALAKARAAGAEPWAERLAGARRGVVSADASIQAFVASNYSALADELGDDARAAASAVDDALSALIDAYARREHAAARSIALASAVRRVEPGEVARTRAEAVARAAEGVLMAGGESPPLPPALPVPGEAAVA